MTEQSIRHSRTVEAFNTHSDSENQIHDDEIAATYGFRGALVPGVTVFAYMAQLPVREWGAEWLDRGGISVSFSQPVYDGELVTAVSDGGQLEVHGPDGDVRATATAIQRAAAIDAPVPPAAALPSSGRPAASPSTLAVGTVLGSLHERFDPADVPAYLASVREDHPVFADGAVAHPGWLLLFANRLLVQNVVLGPWIHVASDITFVRAVAAGQTVETRGVVIEEFERRGHRFVVLDVALLTDDEPAQRVRHTAIYAPRAKR